jgi:hypothetical protein
MHNLTTAVLAACLSIGTASVFAQDAMTKSDAKKSMSMEDCKTHAKEVTGQKASTPTSSDTDQKCADMMKDKDAKMMKKDSMKKDGATPMNGAASGAMK